MVGNAGGAGTVSVYTVTHARLMAWGAFLVCTLCSWVVEWLGGGDNFGPILFFWSFFAHVDEWQQITVYTRGMSSEDANPQLSSSIKNSLNVENHIHFHPVLWYQSPPMQPHWSHPIHHLHPCWFHKPIGQSILYWSLPRSIYWLNPIYIHLFNGTICHSVGTGYGLDSEVFASGWYNQHNCTGWPDPYQCGHHGIAWLQNAHVFLVPHGA